MRTLQPVNCRMRTRVGRMTLLYTIVQTQLPQGYLSRTGATNSLFVCLSVCLLSFSSPNLYITKPIFRAFPREHNYSREVVIFMPIIYHVINNHYLFDFDKSDKMRPCDLLLAGATETFSPRVIIA